VVERTFAWLGRFRRLSKDYEHLTITSEAVIYLAMTRLLVAASPGHELFRHPLASDAGAALGGLGGSRPAAPSLVAS
jgi:hypothetical protein